MADSIFKDGRLTTITNPASGEVCTVDATTGGRHDLTVEVTDFPVEQGVNISDHKRLKPDTLQLECFISNAPARAAQDLPVGYNESGGSAYNMLRRFARSPQLLTVATGLRVYENMALITVSVPMSYEDGLTFTATFKEIRVVSNQQVLVVTREPNAQKKKELGPQATTPVEVPQERRSLIKQAYDAGRKLIKG